MLKQWIVAIAGLGLSTMVMAAPVAGEDYEVLDEPVNTSVDEGQIEVTEAFWYGCPHCYSLEEPLNAWVAELPDDVTFQRLPATMGDVWTTHATAFFAAERLGILEEIHSDFFNAIHQEGRKLTDLDEIAEFFSQYGVSEEEAREALTSFGVKSQINQAHAKMRAYKLMGVPALVVDGRYVITARKAGSLDNMVQIADALVDQVRNENDTQGE